MDMNNNGNLTNEQSGKESGQDDFSFVKAKVKSKGKKKLKKALEVIGLTVLAAVIFGIVARLTFSATGSVMNRFFPTELSGSDADNSQNQTDEAPKPTRSAVELISGTEDIPSVSINNTQITGTASGDKETQSSQTGPSAANPGTAGTATAESNIPNGIVQDEKNGTDSTESSKSQDGGSEIQGSTASSENMPAGDGYQNAGGEDITGTPDASGEAKDNGSNTSDTAATEKDDAENPSDVHNGDDGKKDSSSDGEKAENTTAGSDSDKSDNSIPTEIIPGTEPGDVALVADNPETDTEQADRALIENYLQMISQFRKIADSASRFLVDIRAVESGLNWMDESVETYREITGLIMGSNGVELLILTGYNDTVSADRIEVRFKSNEIIEGSIFNYDRELNLAVVAVPLSAVSEETAAANSIVVLGDSDDIYEGQPVIAVGKPNGYSGSVEYGIITGKDRVAYFIDGEMSLFSTDMTCNSGSDGIITDMSGKLLGIITHVNSEDDAAGICTVVGINSIKDDILKLLNGKDIPYLGVRAEDIPEDILAQMGIPNGVYVNEVLEGSPVADQLRKGDVIVAVGTRTIYSMRDLNKVLLEKEPGTDVRIVFYRSSRKDSPNMSAIVTVAAR